MTYAGLFKSRGTGWWCRQVWRLPEVKLDKVGNLALLFDPQNFIKAAGSPTRGMHYLFYPFVEQMNLDDNLKADMQVALYNTCNKAFNVFTRCAPADLNTAYSTYLIIIQYIAKGALDIQHLPEPVRELVIDFIADMEDIIERLLVRLEEPMGHDKKEAEVRLIMREEAFIFINFMLLGFMFYMFYGFYSTRIAEIPFALFMMSIINDNMSKLYSMFRAQTQEHILETHIQLMSLIGVDIEKRRHIFASKS